MANATDKQGGPFIYAEGQNDAGQPDNTVSVSAHFVSRAESVIEDLIHNVELQHRATCWHKGMNADLVDSKHAAYLTTSVNGTDVDHPNFNDTTPAAAGGGTNVKFQVSGSDVSAYLPAGSAGPVDAQYVTLATNATLTNERVLTEGLGIDFADAGAGSTLTVTLDLGEISTGTPSGADTFVFVDADDQIGKRGTAADTLVALGAASSSTAVTAAATFGTDNLLLRSDGTGRGAQKTTVACDDSMNLSGIGTLASGAHTITQATVGNDLLDLISTATNSDPRTRVSHNRAAVLSGGTVQTLHTFDLSTAGTYMMECRVMGRCTASGEGGISAGESVGYKLFAVFENISGTVTQVGSTDSSAKEDTGLSGGDAAFSISGTNVLLRVTNPGTAEGVDFVWHTKNEFDGPMAS